MKRFILALLIGLFLIPMANASPCMDRGIDCLMASQPVVGAPSYIRFNGPLSLITVNTLAGPIRVASDVASRFEGFINDLVGSGYKPKHIGCYAAHGHVPGSLHHSGRACDVDQRGWNKTAPTMYHIGHLASKWGLRDGCTFRSRKDCGHVDTGERLHRVASHRYHHRQKRYARR